MGIDDRQICRVVARTRPRQVRTKGRGHDGVPFSSVGSATIERGSQVFRKGHNCVNHTGQ